MFFFTIEPNRKRAPRRVSLRDRQRCFAAPDNGMKGGRRESNPRMVEPQSTALTSWLRPPFAVIDYNIFFGNKSRSMQKMKIKSLQLSLGIGGIALAGLGGLMILTNPEQTAYEEYASDRLEYYLKENACEEVEKGLGNLFPGGCNSLVNRLSPQLQQFIAQKTERHNFLFFSIYTTDLSVHSLLPGYHFETVGVLQNFYTYKGERL